VPLNPNPGYYNFPATHPLVLAPHLCLSRHHADRLHAGTSSTAPPCVPPPPRHRANRLHADASSTSPPCAPPPSAPHRADRLDATPRPPLRSSPLSPSSTLILRYCFPPFWTFLGVQQFQSLYPSYIYEKCKNKIMIGKRWRIISLKIDLKGAYHKIECSRLNVA
jgi:hypothetical protein